MVREDGSSASNELIVTGGHVGTHVDALAHVSHEGLLHGGVDAAQAQAGGRFSEHGIDKLAPFVSRGVLLDVAGAHGVDVLDGGQAIEAEDVEAALEHGGVELRKGDVALVRTGWARHWTDPQAFIGHDSGVPGPATGAAAWLLERGIRATGSDTTAYEHVPAGAGHRLLPVHRMLLVEHGVHIIEMLDLEPLAAAGVHEFAFVLAPLKVSGGTGSPVRPLALVDA
jgi:kynurenine formamidase